MTVRELIEKLQRLPQDATVVRGVTEIDKDFAEDFVVSFMPVSKLDGGTVYEQYTFTKVENAYTLNGHDRPDLAYLS
mgnify:CR=1 FL=1